MAMRGPAAESQPHGSPQRLTYGDLKAVALRWETARAEQGRGCASRAVPVRSREAAHDMDLLSYQREAVSHPARLTWNCWARQTGKSFTFSLRRLLRGLSRRRNQIILSAGERQSREVMEKARAHCHALRLWYEWRGHDCFRGTSIRQLEIRLSCGVRIIGLPANPLTARGFTGDVFLDEFAMHRDDDGIWAALFPTIMRGAGELDVASTPRGQHNVFCRLRENPAFSATLLTLSDAAARGLEVDVAAVRAGIGDDWAWRQEFCCEFLDEASSFLPYALIRSCQDAGLDEALDRAALARRGAELYAGIDVGRHRDLTALWLWERQGEALVTRGVLVMRETPLFEQEERITEVLRHGTVRRCCVDATGLGLHLAENLAERFGGHRVEKVVMTAAVKSEMAGRLKSMAERGQLRIPVDETIAADWHALSRVVTSSGHVRLDAARRGGEGHGDRFWAAALGLHAAADAPASTETGFVAGGRLTFAREGTW